MKHIWIYIISRCVPCPKNQPESWRLMSPCHPFHIDIEQLAESLLAHHMVLQLVDLMASTLLHNITPGVGWGVGRPTQANGRKVWQPATMVCQTETWFQPPLPILWRLLEDGHQRCVLLIIVHCIKRFSEALYDHIITKLRHTALVTALGPEHGITIGRVVNRSSKPKSTVSSW